MTGAILALNSGSSSFKYAVFDGDHVLRRDTIEGVRDPAAAIERLLGDLTALPSRSATASSTAAPSSPRRSASTLRSGARSTTSCRCLRSTCPLSSP